MGSGLAKRKLNLANFTDPNQLRRVIAARAAQSVPGERFELPTNGLQNRCSTTELTRQINDLQDRSEAWLQLVAVSSRNSRPAPLEPHLCLRRPGKCPPLSARPREGHPATHSASQTRVNALLPSRGRRCGDPAWPWIPAFAGMSGVCCTVGASHFKR